MASTAKKKIQHSPQRINVGAQTDCCPVAPGLLWRHIAGGAQDRAMRGIGNVAACRITGASPLKTLARPQSITRTSPNVPTMMF